MHSSNALRPTKRSSQSRMANTEADRGRPSMRASSPAIEPGPRTASMRLSPRGGGEDDLDQALLQRVAAVARVSDHEQRFASLEVMRCRPREQLYRQRLRQARQYGGGFGSPAFHNFSPRKAPSKLSHIVMVGRFPERP